MQHLGGEPSSDLLSTVTGKQRTLMNVYAGVKKGSRNPVGEGLKDVDALSIAVVDRAEVVDLVDHDKHCSALLKLTHDGCHQ